MPPKQKPVFFEMVLNILGYKEEGEWVALALEMDLRGYGKTFEHALSELSDLVAIQVGFAHFKGQPEMIYKPADPVWFQLFADARRAKFETLDRDSGTEKTEWVTGALPIPPAYVIAKIQNTFNPED